MGKAVIWTNHAIAELNEEFLELLERCSSIETTTKVITEVHDSVSILQTHAEIYELDELRKKNDGSIRAYEKHTYRISYQITTDTIYVIRVRYARKDPLLY